MTQILTCSSFFQEHTQPVPVYHPTPGESRLASQLTEEEQIRIAQRIGLIQHLPRGIFDPGSDPSDKKVKEWVLNCDPIVNHGLMLFLKWHFVMVLYLILHEVSYRSLSVNQFLSPAGVSSVCWILSMVIPFGSCLAFTSTTWIASTPGWCAPSPVLPAWSQ